MSEDEDDDNDDDDNDDGNGLGVDPRPKATQKADGRPAARKLTSCEPTIDYSHVTPWLRTLELKLRKLALPSQEK